MKNKPTPAAELISFPFCPSFTNGSGCSHVGWIEHACFAALSLLQFYSFYFIFLTCFRQILCFKFVFALLSQYFFLFYKKKFKACFL